MLYVYSDVTKGLTDIVTECGTMNAFLFWKNEDTEHDEIVTCPLDGTILPGVTRDSVLQLIRKFINQSRMDFTSSRAARKTKKLTKWLSKAEKKRNEYEAFSARVSQGPITDMPPIGPAIPSASQLDIQNAQIEKLRMEWEKAEKKAEYKRVKADAAKKEAEEAATGKVPTWEEEQEAQFDWKDVTLKERHFTMSEVVKAAEEGRIHAMWCCGTAAIISPVNRVILI